jgi:hypothetical protein
MGKFTLKNKNLHILTPLYAGIVQIHIENIFSTLEEHGKVKLLRYLLKKVNMSFLWHNTKCLEIKYYVGGQWVTLVAIVQALSGTGFDNISRSRLVALHSRCRLIL